MKILGREPAAFVALVGSVLTMIATLNVTFLSPGQSVAVIGVVSAAVLAWTTRPVTPGLLTGAWVAIAGLFAEYGLDLSDEVIGAVGATILALFAFITREQVSPTDTLVTHQ